MNWLSVIRVCGLRTGLVLFVASAGAFFGLSHAAASTDAQGPRIEQPNYEQALKYSNEYLRQFVYDTAVNPHWIGKTDIFWYSYRTSAGTHWYRVNPKLAAKEPLFDCEKLGSQLSEMVQKPLDCAQLPLQRESVSDDGNKFKFVVDDFQYEYDLQAETLAKLGKAPAMPAFQGQGRGRRGFGRGNFQQFQQQQQEIQLQDQQQRDNQQIQNQQQNDQQTQQQNTQGRRGRGFGGRGGRGGLARGPADYRNFSPDRAMYVFARNHNLYLVVVKKEADKTEAKKPAKSDTDELGDDDKKDEIKKEEPKTQPANKDPDADAIQLTTDGVEDYDFAGGFGRGRGVGQNNTNDTQQQLTDAERAARKTRPNVTWSKDSKSFFVTRVDNRGVQELWVMNSLSQPRPTIEKYKYAMPGEDAVPKSELFVFTADNRNLKRVTPKWIDEGYSDVHFGKTGQDLRFVRHDRLLRHDELCSMSTTDKQIKCLIAEGFENANLATESVTYVEGTDEMVWWSERSGWAHYYLYDHEGKLKNAITSGPYRSSRIVDLDPKNRLLFFIGNGRESGENVYFEHLYRVHLDGTDLVLMDPGDATHRSELSPSHEFVVDNCSRVDAQPVSYLRDSMGRQIMELEKADLSQLQAVGWKMPETFTVKAADGVTDLYGNMWKPFDFDPRKKYPIIAHVYPGPQMEGTTYTFSAIAAEQQLAQVGFIVIQVGHRGGSPQRSKAYGSFGYFNLRDYGLADKKAAIEQLAARFTYIDLDRVGIYGHSGGGFMTAAAMLQKPYNEFFKVGVSESGNHDNNIYNQGWSERYHGLKEVVITGDGKTQTRDLSSTGAKSATNSSGAVEQGDQQNQQSDDQSWEQTDWLSYMAAHQADPSTASLVLPADDDASKKDAKTDNATSDQKKSEQQKVKFEIHVPTNVELAANLRGHLLLIHGESDNNVHPANTLRLVDALIKANKRFDMIYLPGTRHAYGEYTPYTTQRTWEYFAQHLLGDYQPGADIYEKAEPPVRR
ncbi:MAG TPA: DPP IV N-terminal domain-containing protein [Tepidisphaeraceae bacterium]|nr:DPP IV N-terminal domain-containing protein [Tepidisphaeraceae bacterium]